MKNIENFEHFLNEGQTTGKPVKVVKLGGDSNAIAKLNKEIKKSIAGGNKVRMSLTKEVFHVMLEIPAGVVQYDISTRNAAEVLDLSMNMSGGA